MVVYNSALIREILLSRKPQLNSMKRIRDGKMFIPKWAVYITPLPSSSKIYPYKGRRQQAFPLPVPIRSK